MRRLPDNNPETSTKPAGTSDLDVPSAEMFVTLDNHIETILGMGDTYSARTVAIDLVVPTEEHTLYMMSRKSTTRPAGAADIEDRHFALVENNRSLASISITDGTTVEYRIANAPRVRELCRIGPAAGKLPEEVAEYIGWLLEPLDDSTGLRRQVVKDRSTTGEALPKMRYLRYSGETGQTEYENILLGTASDIVEDLCQHTRIVESYGNYIPGRYIRAFREKYIFDKGELDESQDVMQIDYRDREVQFGWYTGNALNGDPTGCPVLLNPPPCNALPLGNTYEDTDIVFASPEWDACISQGTHQPTAGTLRLMNRKLAEHLVAAR